MLPGVVDAHVHLGDDITLPRTPEDVRPETAAAAAGGVTTLIAYLMSPEPYDDVFPVARRAMEADAAIDFGFHFCIGTREQLDAIPHYIADLGVSSFKFFMNFRTDEGQRLGLPGNDDGFLFELLEAVGDSRRDASTRTPRTPTSSSCGLVSGVLDGEGSPLELLGPTGPRLRRGRGAAADRASGPSDRRRDPRRARHQRHLAARCCAQAAPTSPRSRSRPARTT